MRKKHNLIAIKKENGHNFFALNTLGPETKKNWRTHIYRRGGENEGTTSTKRAPRCKY